MFDKTLNLKRQIKITNKKLATYLVAQNQLVDATTLRIINLIILNMKLQQVIAMEKFNNQRLRQHSV